MRKLDLTNQKFGRLTALYENGKTQDGRILWHCVCECGNETNVQVSSLRGGTTRSCGCLYRETLKTMNKIHGFNKHGNPERIYRVWQAMKNRCKSQKHAEFNLYGGRGIDVCDEWKSSFKSFADWAFSHGYNDELQIDRIDNDKGYFPENCRFVTRKQNCNNRRSSRRVLFRGEMRTSSEISDLTGIPYDVIYQRITKLHWSGEDLAKPSRLLPKRKKA